MKAITIKQPWATLIALGEKKFETRSWATKHRGPLAIHAGKSVDKEAFDYIPIENILKKHGIHSWRDLPTGVVIATVDLVECHKVVYDNFGLTGDETADLANGLVISGNEWDFGNYSEGRYAWEIANLQVLPEPVSAKGQLSLWNWEESDWQKQT